MSATIDGGRPAPLGATPSPQGTNFAVSSNSDVVRLCLFGADGTQTQLLLPGRDGDVWHGFVPGVAPGRAYGYRVSGPYDRANGQRYNPAKLLLDPYARAINGDVRFGPELLDYAMDNTGAPSPLDSAGEMPRSVVTAGPATPVPPGPGHRRPSRVDQRVLGALEPLRCQPISLLAGGMSSATPFTLRGRSLSRKSLRSGRCQSWSCSSPPS